MIDPAIFIGEPLNFQNKLKVYPPCIKDVVTNPKYGIFYKILTMSQDDIKDELKGKLKEGEQVPTPFEYLLISCQYISGFSKIVKSSK